MPTTRLLTPDDAPALAELVLRNRDFLAPWEPLREDAFFTPDMQLRNIESALVQYDAGVVVPLAILDETGAVTGRITLNGIVRAAFQSCSMGYWLSEAATGRGLATAAVREVTRFAFGELGLHRVQAETLPHNVRSQRVLERTGFTRYGVAPTYLKIAGHWQDCVMHQLIAPAGSGAVGSPSR